MLTLVGFPQFQRALFFIAVNPLAGKHELPINLVPIEFRTVNTDELGNSAYGNAAAAAHAGAVDHNRVEANYGGDSKRLGS
jgi:hypothetical protein